MEMIVTWTRVVAGCRAGRTSRVGRTCWSGRTSRAGRTCWLGRAWLVWTSDSRFIPNVYLHIKFTAQLVELY
jgi:hypothetical protein